MAVGSERAMFVVWDYLVFSLVLLVSASIGVFYGCSGGRQKTTAEFFMGDRKMQLIPVSLSMLASFMSAIMLLGTPAEVYLYGTQYLIIGVGYIMLMPVAAYLYIPIFYHLQLTSAYEYLELRFKKKLIRLAGTSTFIFQMILYMAIVLYAPSLALNAVTGLNVWVSVISVGCVCTFYTTLGGMKAVMWTDVFQVTMMMAGLLAVIIQGSIDNGGFINIWQIAKEGGRIQFDDFNPDPGVRHTVWSLSFGALFTWLAIYGVNQSQVQRALSCPDLRTAQIAVLLNAPGLLTLMLLTGFCGLIMFAHFKDCDPLENGQIWASDQLLPLYVMEALRHLPGLPGLFVACLFSGALSTVSSGLNSLAAVTIQDFIRGYFWPDISESRATMLAKIMAFVYGVVMILLTIVAAQLGSVLQAALGLFGIIGGPLLGMFTLGMFFPQANWKGAFSGLLVGLLFMMWIGVGATIYPPISYRPPVSTLGCPANNVTEWSPSNDTMVKGTYYANPVSVTTIEVNYRNSSDDFIAVEERPAIARLYSLSYLWYSSVAVLIVCGVGLPVSFITGASKPEDVDPRTISPLFHIVCPCLPNRWQQHLSCGVEHDGKYTTKDVEECKQLNDDHHNPLKNVIDRGSSDPTKDNLINDKKAVTSC